MMRPTPPSVPSVKRPKLGRRSEAAALYEEAEPLTLGLDACQRAERP